MGAKKKNEVSAASSSGTFMEGGCDKAASSGRCREVYVSLAMIPAGIRDVWCVSGVRWCVTCMGSL